MFKRWKKISLIGFLERSNVVETLEGRIQDAFLTAMDNFITTRIELAVRSINESSRDFASVTASSERGEEVGNSALFGKVSDRNSNFVS